MGVLHWPHPKNKKIKRVSRLVILPDYQGIGLGTKFLDVVANMYIKNNFYFTIITSAKNMIKSLKQNKKWVMVRYSKNKIQQGGTWKAIRTNCYTASFWYKGI